MVHPLLRKILDPPLAAPGCIPGWALKVAEHSFQVPMPNTPLLTNCLCFGAHFLQEPSLTTEVFILAFWLECVLAG